MASQPPPPVTPPTAGGPAPMRASAPFGVTLVVILMWINAILEIILGVLAIAFSGNVGTQDSSGMAQGALVMFGVIAILIGLITILLATALFRGSNGVRILVSILIVIQICIDVYELAKRTVGDQTPWGSVITILLWLIILALLWTSRASAFFKQR